MLGYKPTAVSIPNKITVTSYKPLAGSWDPSSIFHLVYILTCSLDSLKTNRFSNKMEGIRSKASSDQTVVKKKKKENTEFVYRLGITHSF